MVQVVPIISVIVAWMTTVASVYQAFFQAFSGREISSAVTALESISSKFTSDHDFGRFIRLALALLPGSSTDSLSLDSQYFYSEPLDAALVEALERFTALSEIHVDFGRRSYTPLTSDALWTLTRFIKRNTSLKRLNIRCSTYGDDAVLWLNLITEVLMHHPSLKYCFLDIDIAV